MIQKLTVYIDEVICGQAKLRVRPAGKRCDIDLLTHALALCQYRFIVPVAGYEKHRLDVALIDVAECGDCHLDVNAFAPSILGLREDSGGQRIDQSPGCSLARIASDAPRIASSLPTMYV